MVELLGERDSVTETASGAVSTDIGGALALLWHTENSRQNFFVYYWIDEAKEQVTVTAVVYGRRDQVTALLEMPLE